MKILTWTATGRVIVRLADDDPITYRDGGALVPGLFITGASQAATTLYEDTDTPTADAGRFSYDGQTFTDLWPYAALTPLQFWRYVTTTAGMDAADRAAARADANLTELWWEFGIATEILRESDDTVAALAALVALEHITGAQRDTVLADWPRAAPA